MKKVLYTLLAAILAALCYNGGFFFIDHLWFLTPLSLLMLVEVLLSTTTLLAASGVIALWGLVVYSLHFIWLLALLLNHSDASVLLAGALYSGVVCYYLLLTLIFFIPILYLCQFMNKSLARAGVLGIAIGFYFYFIESYSLSLYAPPLQYRFINPLIPLLYTNYKRQAAYSSHHDFTLYHLEPDIHPAYDHPLISGQRIYQKLARLPLDVSATKPIIILAPESSFAFPLNEYADYAALWARLLPDNAYFIIGTQRTTSTFSVKKNKKKFKYYQSLFLITARRITELYDKQLLVPFYEKPPKLFKNNSSFTSLFLQNKTALSRGKTRAKSLSLTKSLFIQPLLCSELFLHAFNTPNSDDLTSQTILMLFLNETWFITSFQKWMKAIAWGDAQKGKRPFIFISHRSLEWLSH